MSETVTRVLKFSASDINRFRKCPFQWKLTKIDRVNGIATDDSRAFLGKSLHLIIKDYYSNIPDRPSKETIEKVVWSSFDNAFPQSLNRFKESAKEMIINFIAFEWDRIKKGGSKPLFVEQRLEDEYFVGILDVYFKENGGLLPDWKTGQVVSVDDDMRIQGCIYRRLLVRNGYDVKKIVFVALRTGRVLESPFTTEGWLIEQVKRMLMMYQNGKFPKIKSPLCSYCSVQLECELGGYPLWSESII